MSYFDKMVEQMNKREEVFDKMTEEQKDHVWDARISERFNMLEEQMDEIQKRIGFRAMALEILAILNASAEETVYFDLTGEYDQRDPVMAEETERILNKYSE